MKIVVFYGQGIRSEERRVGKECRYRWLTDVSSRRRHTRCGRDWSSDVCSSDLIFTWYFLFYKSVSIIVMINITQTLDCFRCDCWNWGSTGKYKRSNGLLT